MNANSNQYYRRVQITNINWYQSLVSPLNPPQGGFFMAWHTAQNRVKIWK
jgi:putative component of membrane protein insertase Oxa1/YidC/SpoIIIJ protein YidD